MGKSSVSEHTTATLYALIETLIYDGRSALSSVAAARSEHYGRFLVL